MSKIELSVVQRPDGWDAEVTVHERTTTRHRVRVSKDEHERYGGGPLEDLVRRSFAFLLEREPNTSILRDFDLSVIERYFPEFGGEMRNPI